MHTQCVTSTRRALALGALLLASACTHHGLGRQPANQSAAMAASTPSAAPTTTETTSGPEVVQATPSATADTTAPMPDTVVPEPDTTAPPATTAPSPRPTVAPAPAAPAAVDGLPRELRRIGGCESTGDPDGPLLWRQPNLLGSTASGAFQVLDSTWATWASTYGAGTDAASYRRAMHAPPATQLAVVVRAHAAEGATPWASSRACWAG